MVSKGMQYSGFPTMPQMIQNTLTGKYYLTFWNIRTAHRKNLTKHKIKPLFHHTEQIMPCQKISAIANIAQFNVEVHF